MHICWVFVASSSEDSETSLFNDNAATQFGNSAQQRHSFASTKFSVLQLPQLHLEKVYTLVVVF